MSKKIIIIISVIIAALLFLFGLWVGRKTAPKISSTPKVETRTKKVASPREANEKVVGSITVSFTGSQAVENIHHHGNEPVENIPRHGNEEAGNITSYNESCDSPSVVELPITQKEYRDSDYTAYVSGFHAKLDSIEVRTKEVTYTKTEIKFRRWNIGLTGGYGYGFRSKQFEPFVGIGITLNIFR